MKHLSSSLQSEKKESVFNHEKCAHSLKSQKCAKLTSSIMKSVHIFERQMSHQVYILNFLKYHQIYWCPFMKLSFFYKFLTLIDRNPEIPSLFTQLLLNFPIWKHNWSSECLPGENLVFSRFLKSKENTLCFAQICFCHDTLDKTDGGRFHNY